MQAQYCLTEKFGSFLRILSAHRTTVIIILLLALTCRGVLTFRFPLVGPDERRYTVPAVNMLAGRGFSVSLDPPYLPSKQAMPLYPLFIAGVYAVFGRHNVAVRIAQDLLDLITCVLIAFVSFSLAPMRVRYAAALAALAIYGFLSWFTLHWTRFVLTETLAVFLTTLAIAAAVLAIDRRWFWAVAGGVCGLALLTRGDSVLLIAAFGLFLMFQIARTRSLASVGSLLIFSAATLLVMAPWVVRNYVSFGKLEPLASEYGFARDQEMPVGYLAWIRTWMTDETHFQAFLPAFAHQSFNPDELPDDIFDSPEEKARVVKLLEARNESGGLTAEMSNEFREIANQRIRRAPLRFYVWLPIKRIGSCWLTSFSTYHRPLRFLRIVLVLPILIGGLLGMALFAVNRPLNELIVMIIVIRSVFLGYFYAPEARYIVEAYPAMIAACGVTVAVAWRYLVTRTVSLRRVKGISARAN
jgi:4-amino-4-deoxy-L-arabinose transferase-like glycosyltransferase